MGDDRQKAKVGRQKRTIDLEKADHRILNDRFDDQTKDQVADGIHVLVQTLQDGHEDCKHPQADGRKGGQVQDMAPSRS